MKFSKVLFPLLLVIFFFSLVSQDTVKGRLPLLVTPNPNNGTTVSTDLAYMRVLVTSNRKVVEDCLIKFYLDGEYIDQKTTNGEGLTLFDILPEIGEHTWFVRAEKIGYNRHTSPTFTFYFHPERILTVKSIWGKTFGTGNYPIGDTIDFGVKPSIIYSGNNTRFVFQEWQSTDENGYNGFREEWFVHLNDDIAQVARWTTQHYIEFKAQGSGTVSKESGWYEAGSILDVTAESGLEHFFSNWEGSGSGSYTGDEAEIQIQVFAPITQTSIFQINAGAFIVDSEYGETFGSGYYDPGEMVEFGVFPEIYYVNENARYLFSGWSSTSENGYTGKEQNHSTLMGSSIIQNANWVKQFYVEFEASNSGFVSRDSDWYNEGDIIQVTATPENGYEFIQWTKEDNINLGNQVEYEIEILSPISIRAEFASKKTFDLQIVSDLIDFSEDLEYYEQEVVELYVPEIVEVGDTRHVFQSWATNSTSGYNGTDNNATIIITEQITQYVSWLTYHYVSSTDPLLVGWYKENEVIKLGAETNGVFTRETKYKVNGEITSSFVTVTEPLSIEPYSTFNYSILLIGAGLLALLIIGVVTYRVLTE